MDELDIDIALQRFDEAVARVESLTNLAKGLRNNTVARDFIAFKAEERATRLAGLITHELVECHNSLTKTKRSVHLLARLGFEDRAREAYLEARGGLIHKRSRYVVISSIYVHPNGSSDNVYSKGIYTNISGRCPSCTSAL
jgi:hypothetical protein